jgi:FtsP/CotA-like multicopper oxidase with cupredoxin domain
MTRLAYAALSRRTFLRAGVAAALFGASAHIRAAAAGPQETRLVAGPARVPLMGSGAPDTDVWAYDGSVPGPLLRFRQGETVRIAVENRLAEETTVHWHGVRVPNAMDGVPFLTQRPIAPGETFRYEFAPPDAGTYWYHPHQRSLQQVGRGLYGAFIVDEPAPVAVDRDLIWLLGDWRLGRDASINDDFGNHMDMMMGGHIGTTVTINGQVPSAVPVRAGERLRLRLINAAPARIFALEFGGHRPRIVALDGQPVAPHEPEGGRIVLGPAMRADIVLDMTGRPGERFPVNDTFYAKFAYRLVDLAYADGPPMREQPLETELRLPANPLPEPDLSSAERHEIQLGGGMMMGAAMMGGGASGMMDGGMMGGGMMQGMMSGGMMGGAMWTINGVAATEHTHEPLLFLKRGGSYLFTIRNETEFHHPIHLHGHSFRVVSRNGQPTPHREWQDTVLVSPREIAEIAFVADNPGDWMLHCHVLDHQEGGMMATVRVA